MSDRTRRIAVPVLATLAALALLGATAAGYLRHTIFDADDFADRAATALDDEAVRNEVAIRITDGVVIRAQADLIAARPVILGVVDGIVGGGAFQSLFSTAVRDVHRALFDGDVNTATLTIADIGVVLRGAIEALRPQLADDIPGGLDLEIGEIKPPAWVANAAQVADGIEVLELILLLTGLALAAVALALSRDRRRTAVQLGVAVVVFGVAGVVALSAVRAAVLNGIDEAGPRDAVAGIWSAFLGDLTTLLYLFSACGAVVAAAASSLRRPVDIFAPLRRAGELLTTVPERRGWRAVRAVTLIAAGVLIVLNRDAFVDLVALLVGLYVAYAGVSELMRLTLPEVPAEAQEERAQGRRALIATGIAAGLILLGGAVFVGVGGIAEAPATIETVGCNGSEELCDQALNDAVFPSTHNAMSAATNPGWLFAQQEAGFPDQLREGIRGLFIDAHYGTPTESGKVKTDLSDLDGPERDAYEEALGPEALEAALRIRDRIVNSPPTGPRGVYLCHRFCELGALQIDTGLRQIRDFLAANPDEVVAIVIEDYVTPADIDAAIRRSGLIDYVYDGPLDPAALPTLQEIIDSGGRAMIMAENADGGAEVPYLHAAYDALVQETPYSFKQPALLTDPANLTASCEPNRGPDDAPLFLVNHWVDTSPAPRPSNAAKVNARDALLARIRQCEEQRGVSANFISVDFYRQGDVFEVAEELNAERAQPSANAE
jgi:hypothetical protein